MSVDFSPVAPVARSARSMVRGGLKAGVGRCRKSAPPGEATFPQGPVQDFSGWIGLAEEAAGLGYWRLDVATGTMSSSEGLLNLYGLPSGGLPDLRSAMAAMHPQDAERATRLVQRATEFGEDFADQARIRLPDGSWRVVTNRSICKRDETGAVATVYGVVMDVTEMERALRKSETRYRALAENGNDLVVESDLTGRITYISPSALTVTGFEPAELVGRKISEHVHAEDLPALDLAIRQAFQDPARKGRCVQYRVRHKDGRRLWLEACPTPLFDEISGIPIGVTDVVRDITERKAMDAALLAKCEEAEAATRAKAEFLANMSHEIRTPLTAIMGFSGLLSSVGDLPHVAQTYVQRISTAGEQLMDVVNDVLDFSRLDAGQVELDPQPLDPAALVLETIDLLSAQAAAKQLRLTASIAENTPSWVLLDGGRMRQILLNLIGNAIKFTPSGSVTVTLTPDREAALRVTVADTGPGIPPDQQSRLFERFSQMDGSISRGHGGAGLGLAICKGLVELMGGAIGVDSTAGRGSTFWFTLPAPRAIEPAAPALCAPAAVEPRHILLVDDVAVNRFLVRAMLAPFGHTFEEAATGHEAVQAAMQRPFDLILMDLQMPGMGGLEATRAIRSTAEVNREVPIVALSANVLAEQIAECHAAGMDDHLAKPIVPVALLAVLSKWTQGAIGLASRPHIPQTRLAIAI